MNIIYQLYTIPPHKERHAHTPKLCCCITTIDLLHFKFSDFNKELSSSLKMIWIMIETCWSIF